MVPKISACVFTKDNNIGAFGLWESVASLMPFADEYLIMDLGSTDGTLETLKDLASRNPKIRLEHSSFYKLDNSIFADLANDMIAMCKNEIIICHQADEIWHEDLLETMRSEFEKIDVSNLDAWQGMGFWRYQLRDNFQKMKWWPHLVNLVDLKSRFKFVGDGMNSSHGCPTVGNVGSQTNWQEDFKGRAHEIPTNQMILDIGMIGGFLNVIPTRRRLHAPIWGESPEVIYIDGKAENLEAWYNAERGNQDWFATETPFNIPEIMRGHLGKLTYKPRADVLDRIARG